MKINTIDDDGASDVGKAKRQCKITAIRLEIAWWFKHYEFRQNETETLHQMANVCVKHRRLCNLDFASAQFSDGPDSFFDVR